MRRIWVVTLAFAAVPFAHALLIDDFTTGPYHNAISSGSSSASQSATVPGGTRLTAWSVDQNPFSTQLTIDLAGGFASIGNGPGMVSRVEFAYGNFTTNALNANLNASGDRFRVDVAYNEDPLIIRMFLYSSTFGGYLPTYQSTIAATTTGSTFDIPFSAFGVSQSNFNDIDEIHFQFENAASGDYVIRSFGVVPEPATLVALGLGGLGLLSRRRRRA